MSQIRLTVRDGRPAPRGSDSVCPAIPDTDANRDRHATRATGVGGRHSHTDARAFGDGITGFCTIATSCHALPCRCDDNRDLAGSGHGAPGRDDATAVHPTPEALNGSPPTTVAPTDKVQPDQPLTRPAGLLQVYETTLTLSTYNYEAAFQPTSADDPIHPYPRLDSARVGPPVPRDYQAIVLENDFVVVTVLPQLGGRVYRWIDKATARHLLYENPVVKPTQWGYRGWWLAVGGIEWAFPVEEHGLNEWRPWAYSVARTANGISVTVTDTEDRTGVTVGATISLDAVHSYLTLAPWARNDTSAAQSYQLWLNAMVTLGDNRAGPSMRLILPTDQVIVHSTGDGTLPGAWQPLSWPIYGGRDLSHYGNWTAYLGFFAPRVSEGFVRLV